MLADGVALGDRGDHGLAEVLRVRAREADALDSLDGVAGAQQLAELGADRGREVAAPRVDVLAEQRQLLHARGGEPGHLGEDLARAAALLAAAHRRDDAVRADRVAAHRDLHPRLERPLAVLSAASRRTRGRRARTRRARRPRRPRRASRRGARSSRARTRRRPRGRARRCARAAPRRSSRRPRSRGTGRRACGRSRRRGSAASFVSGFSRIVQVLKTTTSASAGGRRLAEPELLEQALDPLRVVGVHLAAEGGDVVAAHGSEG